MSFTVDWNRGILLFVIVCSSGFNIIIYSSVSLCTCSTRGVVYQGLGGITWLSNVLNVRVPNKLVQPHNMIMYEALNLPGLIPVQHTKFYMQNLTCMQDTQSNSHIVLDSDSSAA